MMSCRYPQDLGFFLGGEGVPMIPIFSFGEIEKFIFFRIRESESMYEADTFSNLISPDVTIFGSSSGWSSGGRF